MVTLEAKLAVCWKLRFLVESMLQIRRRNQNPMVLVLSQKESSAKIHSVRTISREVPFLDI